jgi:[ribosomal protein S18]-alanine N-acetyltransferase
VNKKEREKMSYIIKQMSQQDVASVISWKYTGIYSFYNMDEDPEDLYEFREEAANNPHYWSVYHLDQLIGFFSYVLKSGNQVEIGLGMSPVLVGNGHGYEYLKAGIEKAIELYRPLSLVMSVADFNERAIKVYQRAGFQKIDSFQQHTNGGVYPFIKMQKELD